MDISKLADALESCIATATGGWANERALSRFNKLAQAIEARLEDGEAQQRIRDLRVSAELLYSTRRHRRWERGVAELRQAMLAELTNLRFSASWGRAASPAAIDPAGTGTRPSC